MNRVANLSRKEREELFIVTAREINLPEAMTEKDFWVCWTLDYLFHTCPWSKHLAFKGGTSLSKCFGLIERFSEDIDVILDWRLLGYDTNQPWAENTKNQRDKFNKEANSKTEAFLRKEFLPRVQADFQHLLSDDFKLYIDDADLQTICFAYPRVFGEVTILPVVRIEIGALAAWTPVKYAAVTSYAAQKYPQVFEAPSTQILTVAPERTFWEKVTILHKEAFRTNGKFPSRYSRHFYDLFCMDKSPVKKTAFADVALLEHVVKFKDRFYPSGFAHYELANPGTIRLMPPDDCLAILSDDYEHMKNMIFGAKPSYGDIMDCIRKLEREINADMLRK
ncbi:MAG: nucleotidyl transferase AbiEii/AbiGii toxin family protein [Clostridia bacterium]|nr:nucleotidyl transferase AbiEii/AbiGii toxin family protein [Clostridia bacterium]